MAPILVERRQSFVERQIHEGSWASADLVVSGIADDPIEPGSEGRVTPERINLADDAQEGVLDGVLGIVLVAREDAHRGTPRPGRGAVSPLGALGTPYALGPGEHPFRWGTRKLSGKVGYSSPAIRKNRASAGLDGRARYSVLIDEPRWRLNGRAAFPELLEGQRGVSASA